MYVEERPRLINEIPRGSKRYNTFKKMRPASERSNSTMKEDLKILDKPRVLNATEANILAQMAAIVQLEFFFDRGVISMKISLTFSLKSIT